MTRYLGLSRKSLSVVALIAILALLLVPVASAAEGRGGSKIVIGADEVIDDDLYVAAEELIIDGTVKGDVVVVANTVIVNGTVEGDLLAGGQRVVINGTVGDDARIAGQALVLGEASKVAGDAIAAGFSIDAQPGSQVSGDVWGGFYQGRLAGEVAGDVAGGGGGLEISGRVGGDVDVEVGDPNDTPPFPFTQFMPSLPGGVTIPSVSQGLTVSEGAEIGGELKYVSPAEGNISSGANIGSVTHLQLALEESAKPSPAEVFLGWLLKQARRFVRLLAVGLLLVWWLPGWLRRSAEALRSKPWPSLGWGALSPLAVLVALVAVLAVILLIALLLKFVTGPATLITMLLSSAAGTVTVAYLLLLFYIGVLVSGFALGQLVLERVNSDTATSRIWPIVGGVVLVFLLTLIPVLGTFIGLVLALFGLGGIWLAIRGETKEEPRVVEPASAA